MRKLTRRSFLGKTLAAPFGVALLPRFVKAAPSDRVRVAHIGLGVMGRQHLEWFSGLPNVDVVALCDVDTQHIDLAMSQLGASISREKPSTYTDFRHILDRSDIDAVTIATPDHWHAQIACLAFQSGKDVYGEKPLSYDVKEGQLMLEYLKRYNRIFQLGTQIHATENYHRVAEIIQSGAIGKVHTVRLWKNSLSPDFTNLTVQAPPPSLNWDMWLGPAPYSEYIPEKCHNTYRHFIDYSGGVFADFWCHIADIVWWSVSPSGLRKVRAEGQANTGGVPKWINADFEFDDLTIHWTTQPPGEPEALKRNIGALFEGDQGTLICDYNSKVITINGETVTDLDDVSQTLPRSPGHQQNFIDSIKSRQQPESNLEYVREMTLPMHLALIAWRLGKELKWNAKKEKFRGNRDANDLLSRPYRKEWSLL